MAFPLPFIYQWRNEELSHVMLYMGVPVPGHLRMAERATLHTRMASSGELLLLSEVVMVTCLSFEPCDAHLSSAHPLDSLQGPPNFMSRREIHSFIHSFVHFFWKVNTYQMLGTLLCVMEKRWQRPYLNPNKAHIVVRKITYKVIVIQCERGCNGSLGLFLFQGHWLPN